MANTQKEQVAAFYEAHHSRGKYDYLYGGEDRKNLFIQLVGIALNTFRLLKNSRLLMERLLALAAVFLRHAEQVTGDAVM